MAAVLIVFWKSNFLKPWDVYLYKHGQDKAIKAPMAPEASVGPLRYRKLD